LVRFEKGDFAGALDDFRQASRLQLTDPYPEIFLWLVRSREVQASEANHQLAAFEDKHLERSVDHWGSKVCGFLVGRITETDFLGGTESYFTFHERGHECEAWFYVGIKRLFAGDKKGAADAFEKSIATNSRRFQEYNLSEFELKHLGKS
jgi:lipoprotein NlpI